MLGIVLADTVQFSSVAQLCPTLSDPMDCSPPGSSVHGIFQARVPVSYKILFVKHEIWICIYFVLGLGKMACPYLKHVSQSLSFPV